VAVAAIESFAADVMGVAELDGLLDDFVLFRQPGRAHQNEEQPAAQHRDSHQED
jgi:hypothetical protein